MSGKKILLVFLCIIVLSATLTGCTSKKDYDALKKDYDVATANLTSAQREYATLQTQLAALQKESDTTKATLQAQIDSQTATIAQGSNAAASLQSQLNTVLATQVKFVYTFKYGTQQLSWNLSIPMSEYLYYKNKARTTGSSAYTAMVMDNHGDSLLNVLVQKIKDYTLANNLKKTDTVDLVGAFVQSLQNSNQDPGTPYDDRALYPVETLFEQGGDSEDCSILTAAMLQRLEYSVVLFVFDNPQHVAVGIDVPAPGKQSWEYQSVKYVYLETTGHGWVLGNCPLVYSTLQPTIVPLSK
jgi:hypothetical protein